MGAAAQSYALLHADDASSDGTAARVAQFAPRVRLARSERNLGPADARNFAISHSSGELLAFLDADDEWLPGYLDQLVRLYDNSRAAEDNVGIVACDAYLLEGDMRENETFAERFGSHNAEDYDLWLRIVERGYRAVKTPEPLVMVRLAREGSVSYRLGGMARSFQATYRRALGRNRLNPAQRRIARRQLRFYEAVEQLAAFLDDRREGRGGAYRRLARNLPLFASVVLHSPHRVPQWSWRLATGRLGG